jgi:predicted short-subunit dehydrogenase-like oxidoreductase (DUF2520 family)
MDIVLIGSGNTATVLGRRAQASGHRIVQVYSPHADHANQLAVRLSAQATSSLSSIEKNADLLIIAIKDNAIKSFVREIGILNSLLAHTAGAVPLGDISGQNKRYGVLYPLQSLRKEIEELPVLTMLIDGNNDESKKQLADFAQSIAVTVLEANDTIRLKYHLMGTMVNNFTNHLFALAESYCKNENISFTVLQPLIEETVIRLSNASPDAFQTGPAFRNDLGTLEKHRQLLLSYPALLEFYEKFTIGIQQYHNII